MTPENYKIQVLLRTEGFFRQQKNSRVISKIDSTTAALTGMKRAWGGSWRRRARGAYMQVVFNGKCIGTLPNWRLVAGGGNRQVELRAGSNVLIVNKFNSYIPGDKRGPSRGFT